MYAARTGPLGRHEERARIEQLLDAVENGPTGLALEGAPGIGKTTLWRDGVQSARRRGYRVIATAPAEPDASLAFAGLGDLFDGLPEDTLAGVPDPQRRALAAAMFVSDAAVAPPDPQALPRGVLGVLRGLARTGPLLVAIDDEQWLDRASARVLAFALCRLRDERIGVLLARRPQSDGALWPELARGFGADGLAALALGPLDMRAIHDLIAAQLDHPVARPVLRRIYEASGGNPLYALAIARELDASNGAAGHELPIPRTLAEAMAQRLERLEPRASDPLLVAAALSSPRITSIQAVIPDFSLSDLASAEAGAVIEIAGDKIRFTHPLLASTHYSRAPAERRRELHRLLAEVVSDEEERAHHLALGAEAPDRRLAVALEHAAEHATARGAPEVAAGLLEQACRLTPADAVEALRSRTVAAAEQHWIAGDTKQARQLLDGFLEDLPSGPIRARALKQMALARSDDFEVATALCEEALVEAGDHHRVAAEIEALLAEIWANRGGHAPGLEHAAAAVRRAEQAGDQALLCAALAGQGVGAFFHGEGIQRDVMARAIALEKHAGQLPAYHRPSTALGCQLFWSDDLDAARPLLESSLAVAVEQGDEFDRVGVLFHLAHLEWEAGNEDLAARLTHELLEANRQFGDDQGESYVLWLQAFVAARHGDLDEARARGNDAIEVAGRIGDHFIVAFSTEIVAAVELWTGHPDAAHERMAPLREAMVGAGAGFVGSLTLPLWWLDIEALIAIGRLEESEAVLDDLLLRAHGSENPNALGIAYRCRGLLLAARDDVPAAIESMDAALAEHALRPLPLELGRTLLEKGTLQRRAKRKSAAKQSLERALEVLEPLHATIWVDRARDELGRIGLRRAAPSDGLTPAQQRVVELVVAGMSNREIAGMLFMSLRTVETHLTKVYRELGVKSRAQLVATLAARSSESMPVSGVSGLNER